MLYTSKQQRYMFIKPPFKERDYLSIPFQERDIILIQPPRKETDSHVFIKQHL